MLLASSLPLLAMSLFGIVAGSLAPGLGGGRKPPGSPNVLVVHYGNPNAKVTDYRCDEIFKTARKLYGKPKKCKSWTKAGETKRSTDGWVTIMNPD